MSYLLMLRAARPAGSSATVRAENRRLVISALLEPGRASRASLSRATGLAPTTVSTVVEELADQGLVREERGRSSGGKPPVEIVWDESAGHIVAVDVTSGTGALLDLRGSIIERRDWATPAGRGRGARENVTDWCEELRGLAPGTVLGIGVAVPGLIDADGTVVESLSLDWHGEPLGTHLREHLNLDVSIVNDTQACAFGEYWSTLPAGNAATVSIGAGVGAGLILGGQLIGGAGTAAGELGHLMLRPDGIRCQCGNVGCVETVLAEPRLVERITAAAGLTEPAGASEVFKTAAQRIHEPAVSHVVTEIGDDLGAAIAPLVGTLGIESVSLVGKIMHLGVPLLDSTEASLRRRCLPALARRVRLEFSELGEQAILLGVGGAVFHTAFGTL